MDKLNKILAILNKYQFWVTFGTMLLVAIVCWWVATIGLAKRFSDRKTKLEGDFQGVAIPRNQPNQGVIDQIRQQQDALKRGVFSAWQILYAQQKEKNLLPKALDDEFKRQFEALKPKDELEPTYREQYLNFIKQHLPTLREIIDVRRPPEEKETAGAGDARAAGALGPGGRPGAEAGAGLDRKPARGPGLAGPGARGGPAMGGWGAGAEEEWIGTVEWNDSDYGALENRFEWPRAPSTLAVVLAQEDLWVYEALLRVIKNTNEGATGYATAAVKRIDALEIGSAAAKAWHDAQEAVFKAGGGGAGAMAGPGGTREMAGGMGPAGAGTSGDQEKQLLIEGRYVDEKGQPLSMDAEYPYAKHPYAEFKMMPIRMTLLMDQRRLPKLLVECANSSMPIEVKRVRILKSQGSTIELGSAAATPGGRSAMPIGGPMGRERMGFGERGPGVPGAGRAGVAQLLSEKLEAGPLDVPVEIQGVICIYNPPDREKLGTGAAAEKLAEAVAPPAPTTTAPPGAPTGVPGGAAPPVPAPAAPGAPASAPRP